MKIKIRKVKKQSVEVGLRLIIGITFLFVSIMELVRKRLEIFGLIRRIS